MSRFPSENVPYLSASAIADLTDVPPDTLRTWRQRGFIDAYGSHGANGWWTYSLRDAVAVWAGWRLRNEVKLSEGHRPLSVAFAIAPALIAAVRGEGAWRKYFAAVYTDHTANGGARGWEIWQGDDLHDIPADALVVDRLVNVAGFAASVPPEIRDAILGTDREG